MNINYNKLSQAQAQLDKNIGQTKNINMEEKKIERLIALQVEFNELTNELPFIFKYWKNAEWNRELALGEFVDVVHFMLSVGNDLAIENYEYRAPDEQDMRKLVIGINNMISRLIKPYPFEYKELFNHVLLLGDKLGFNADEIETAYFSKNEVNYERQSSGY